MYTKSQTPKDVKEVPRFLDDELEKIETESQNPEVNSIQYTVHHNEPDKPRAAVLYYADGTNWNPLAGGEGFYYYTSGAVWVKLG